MDRFKGRCIWGSPLCGPGSEDSQRGRVAESPLGRVRPANPRFNDIVPFEWLMDDGVVVEPPRAQAREG